jgi:hypothetical protein
MKDKNDYQIFRDKVFDDCSNLYKVVKPIVKEYFHMDKKNAYKVIIPTIVLAVAFTGLQMYNENKESEINSNLGGLETIVSKNEN